MLHHYSDVDFNNNWYNSAGVRCDIRCKAASYQKPVTLYRHQAGLVLSNSEYFCFWYLHQSWRIPPTQPAASTTSAPARREPAATASSPV